MARRRRSRKGDEFFILIGVIAMGMAATVEWFLSLSLATQVLIGAALTGGIAFIVWGLRARRQRLTREQQLANERRAVVWGRAMARWREGAVGHIAYQVHSARLLSEVDLERFAAQLYARMGYQVKHTGQCGDHGVDVHLTNPHNQVELVQCKQWIKPVGESQVRDLYGGMGHANAVRGWLWAPNGFTRPAKRWAEDKNIYLVDDQRIGILVELVYGEADAADGREGIPCASSPVPGLGTM
jgi:hypothetical protein